jgi:hypothetical protein
MATACFAVEYPIYQPAMRIIQAISKSNPAVITTTFAHQYTSGIIVRLDIPLSNGMQQIAGVTYPITVTGLTTFTVPIDSTSFVTFVDTNCASVIPIGETNDMLTNATRNVLPYPAT